MGLVERVSRAIAMGDVTFDPADVGPEAARLLAVASPWRAADEIAHVVDRVVGLGPIQDLLDDEDVSDVLVNRHDEVWVDRGSGLIPAHGARFSSDDDLIATIERVIAPLGLRIDRSAPMVDARLADGSRLHAILPPAAVDGPHVAIRRFTQRVRILEDLIAAGTATLEQTTRLNQAMRDRETIVVSGGTGAGKTTLLNLLGALISPDERVVTIEDAAELSLPGHVVRLEARPANAEGAGEITIRMLLRSALRLRPDRIIVGEVRGPEALDLISALNTGHRLVDHGSRQFAHRGSAQTGDSRTQRR